MKSYKIYTEEKNASKIQEAANNYFPEGYTLYRASGVWQSTEEQTLILEVISDKSESWNQILTLANEIKAFNGQEAVLVTATQLSASVLV